MPINRLNIDDLLRAAQQWTDAYEARLRAAQTTYTATTANNTNYVSWNDYNNYVSVSSVVPPWEVNHEYDMHLTPGNTGDPERNREEEAELEVSPELEEFLDELLGKEAD